MGNDNSTSLVTEDGKRIVWSWQSNAGQDPWLVPEDQIQWTPFNYEQAIIIEKTYLDKKGIADLGEYCVLISSMIQYRKDDSHRQRRVIRQIIDEQIREVRFLEEPSKPKSVNTPFGTLNDFTEFLMAINSKCRTFGALELDTGTQFLFVLDQMNTKGDLDIHKKNIKKLGKTISEGIQQEGRILGATSNQEGKEFSRQISEIMKNAPLCHTYDNLYKQLMKMYTQQKFLFKRVNTLLREENWKELDNLAPYIFYLTKAFQAKTLAPTPEEIKTWGCLYRGMTLPQDSVSFYDPSKTKYFSWYAFTSTSKSSTVAEKFKSKAPVPGKIEVLFTFDISICCPSQLANVSGVSAFPKEEEVIIAPATLYEIISQEFKDDKCYIQLKVLPPNELQGRMEQGEITLDGLRARNLEELKVQVMNKCQDFELSHQNDITIKDSVSILEKSKNVNTLVVRNSIFEKFGLIKLYELLQKKNLKYLALTEITIKSLAVSLLPKKPLKNLRFIQFASAIIEDRAFTKILDCLCGKSLRAISFHSLRFDHGELQSLVQLASSTSLIYLDLTYCEFTPDNLKDLEQAIPLMQLEHLQILCFTQGDDILQILSRILPKMKTLKHLDFKAEKVENYDNKIEEETYHAFLQCLPESSLTSLTLYGDIDEDKAALLANCLDKSKIFQVCLSSSLIPEDKFLDIILSRTQMNISVSAEFFNNKQNDFHRIIKLLCKYKIYSLNIEINELPLRVIKDLISKLPETQLLKLYLPQKITKENGAMAQIFNLESDGNYEVKQVVYALEDVLKNSKVREICLPEYSDQVKMTVLVFLAEFKLKEIERNDFTKNIFK